MAVTQISRIQHRRGLEQDLPQLTSAELGWSLDTRRLYIGNGTLEEGAPTTGVTRILTEHDISDLTSSTSLVNYTFNGNVAGAAAQTGPSLIAPIVRTLQSKLDDIVSVKDFGAIGDGVTDDTAAINRAIQQIYPSTTNITDPRTRRTIHFPAGTYLTTDTILIPPYAHLLGDGINNSIISQSLSNKTVATICDSKFQTGASLGTNSATLPQFIHVDGIDFYQSNNRSASPSILFDIDSASYVKFTNSRFAANTSLSLAQTKDSVGIYSTISQSHHITFDACDFYSVEGNCISIVSADSVKVINSSLRGYAYNGVDLGASTNFTSIGNYYDGSGFKTSQDTNNYHVSVGDYELGGGLSSLDVGNFQFTLGEEYTISSTPHQLVVASDTTGTINYQINDTSTGTTFRFGTIRYTRSSDILYEETYVDSVPKLDANVYCAGNSFYFSVTSGTAILKINGQQFY